MKECVVGRIYKESEEKRIKYSTAFSYLAAIIDMYQQQVKVGVNSHPHPRNSCKQLLDNMQFNEEKTHRIKFQDRGLGTFIDRYTTEDEVAKIVSYYVSKSIGTGLKNYVSFLISHYYLLHEDFIRNAEFTDL